MTSNVVSLADFKKDKRVAVKVAELAKALEDRNQARREDGYKSVGHDPVGMLLVDVLASMTEAKEEREQAGTYTPAYCDPTNETRGGKYEATKGMSRAELAKRMRQDIKEAQKRGQLPQGLKVSVRTSEYSGGGSISFRITALPETMRLWNPEYVAWRQANPHESCLAFDGDRRYTAEYAAVHSMLEEIHASYNRDNSDSMCDYFDRRYYGDVAIDWQLSRIIRQKEGFDE